MKTMTMHRLALLSFSAVIASALAACGQTEEGFCFPDGDCKGTSAGGGISGIGKAGAGGMGTGGTISVMGGNAGSTTIITGGMTGTGGTTGSGGACTKTSGKFDDPRTCGTCDNDCTKVITGAAAITCTPSAKPGEVPGKCSFDATKGCAPGFFDIDKKADNGCEYKCKKTNMAEIACNGLDDDCDGIIDNGLDLCADKSCGACNVDCTSLVLNGVGKCQKKDPQDTSCSLSTVQCAISKCNDGFYDIDGKPENGCEYACTKTGPELCGDGKDNDCDGLVDTADPDLDPTNPNPTDPEIGKDCSISPIGECGNSKGKKQCVNNVLTCVGAIAPGDQKEVCNGKDDDCNGQTDDNLTDIGTACGNFKFGKCKLGALTCNNNVPECIGAVGPDDKEICNNIDDDCDDIIDGTAPDPANLVACQNDGDCAAGLFCRQRQSEPTKKACAKGVSGEGDECKPFPLALANSPCTPGKTVCKAASITCGGAGQPTGSDSCGVDSNCNGQLDNQPNTDSDPLNCGACGNDCNQNGGNLNWQCVNGACVAPTDPATKCNPGFIDCDGNTNDCETSCTFLSEKEICNGVDDNCNCKVDEPVTEDPNGVVLPTPEQVCGVAVGGSSDPHCLAKGAGNPEGVEVKCTAGKYNCVFAGGYCNEGNPPSCATTQDLCDGKDNNCNGIADESFKPPVKSSGGLGTACASDDGKPKPGDGECRATGTFVCSGDGQTTVCSASAKLKCGVAPGDPTFNQKPCDETCDGKDNDCDGQIDEVYTEKAEPGADPNNYVKHAVVKIGDNLWISQYELSRPSASGSSPGQGNGWWGDPGTPAGVTIDKTRACSQVPSVENPGRVPWFNVSPAEVEQVCSNIGGRICKLSEWQAACRVNNVPSNNPKNDCKWGYNDNCTTTQNTCNLGAASLLPVGSKADCFADWTGVNTSGDGANPAGTVGVFDITGNLREITITDATASEADPLKRRYALMGGAYNGTEAGSTCDFDFYTVDKSFQLFTAGFRCCFDQNPQ